MGRVSLLSSLPLAEKNSVNALVKDRIIILDGEIQTYEVTIANIDQGCDITELRATLVWAGKSYMALLFE